MNTLRVTLGHAFVIAAVGCLPMAIGGCEGPQAISEGEADPAAVLVPSAEGKDDTLATLGIDTQKNDATGGIHYLGGHIEAGIRDAGDVRSLLLNRLAGVYGLTAGSDFEVVGDQRDERGHRYVRLQQLQGGLKVARGQLTAHIGPDGTVLALLGELVPRLHQMGPSGRDGEQAVRAAVEPLRASGSVLVHGPVSEAIFTTGTTGTTGAQRDSVPAFRSVVEYFDRHGRVLSEVYVSQQSGALLAQYTLIHDALSRSLYDLQQGCISSGSNLPGRTLFAEGGTTTDAAAQGAYDGAGTTYWFYKNYFGRDSYDNKGAPLKASVHAQFSSGSQCSPNNAVWLGYPYNQMAYGDGDGVTLKNLALALDVTGHELTHAVTGVTSGLVYQSESGALNEAMSDIIGVTVATWKRAGGSAAGNPQTLVADSKTWQVGADAAGTQLAGGALRFMNNPTQDGYSADYYPQRLTGTADNGGVHGNSGIANLAYYLLSQGGSHPRQKTTTVVTGIGLAKAARIFYTADTSLLTANATFQDARNATAQAAQSLFGVCSAEWTSTHRAWDAVGVPGSWTPCQGGTPGTPPPATINEVKPNNTFATAMAITTSGTTVTGQLASSTDTGYFKVQLPAGGSLSARLTVPAQSDFDLYIYNSNGTLIAKSENGLGVADEAQVTNTGTATFTRYIRVTYYSGSLGSAAPYQLKLSW